MDNPTDDLESESPKKMKPVETENFFQKYKIKIVIVAIM